MQEESPEGGRFKKEIFIDNQSYLLLIRDEGGLPEMQVRVRLIMTQKKKKLKIIQRMHERKINDFIHKIFTSSFIPFVAKCLNFEIKKLLSCRTGHSGSAQQNAFPIVRRGENTKANLNIHERLCQYLLLASIIKWSRACTRRNMEKVRLIHSFRAL